MRHKATFHGNGGYPSEQQRAAGWFVAGETYKVTGGRVGRFRTTLTFDGVPGEWNSVLFDYDHDQLSEILENDYLL